MKKFLKISLLIIIPVAVLAMVAVVYGITVWNNIHFRPYYISLDTRGISAADALKAITGGSSKTIGVTLGLEIKNDSSLNIKFCNLSARLKYDGQVIARTSDILAQQCRKISKNSVTDLQDTVDVTLSGIAGKLLYDKLTGKNPEVEYIVDLSVFGIPVSKISPIKSTFKI